MPQINVSYDILYQKFLSISKTDPYNLPKTYEQKYDLIHNGIDRYNNRKESNISYNDSTEVVTLESETYKYDIIQIIAHYMKLTLLENMLLDFASIWNVFTSEIGVQNYASSINVKKAMIENENNTIEQLIIKITEEV